MSFKVNDKGRVSVYGFGRIQNFGRHAEPSIGDIPIP